MRSAINDRLAWQQPKAIICTVLLALLVGLAVRIWRTLIAKSPRREPRRTLKTVGLRLARWGSVATCVLLMLMVLGNTQASFAPLGLTLVYG